MKQEEPGFGKDWENTKLENAVSSECTGAGEGLLETRPGSGFERREGRLQRRSDWGQTI